MRYQKLGIVAIAVAVGIGLSGFETSSQVLSAQKSLSELEWKKRLLLVKVDELNSLDSLIRQLDYRELAELKLEVYALVANQGFQLLPSGVIKRTPNYDESLALILNSRQASEERVVDSVILKGLDGGVKGFFPLDGIQLGEVRALIDTMPMRQSELKTRLSVRQLSN